MRSLASFQPCSFAIDWFAAEAHVLDGYPCAIRFANRIAQGYPSSTWASAANQSIAKLQGWKLAKERIVQLLDQARTAPDWAAATVLLDQARQLAQLPCL